MPWVACPERLASHPLAFGAPFPSFQSMENPLDDKCTVTGLPPANPNNAPVPVDTKRPDRQFTDHWVLCKEDRAKGYIRPLRLSYRHVGIPGPRYALRDLTPEENKRYNSPGEDDPYVKFETYPRVTGREEHTGRFWTQAKLDKAAKGGCGEVTRMPQACAETYAVNPRFYGSTFCCGCGVYLPVGDNGEFVWDGTDERVGT